MAASEPSEDPREVPWHPRFARDVLGHDAPRALFQKAFASGRPHHAWLIHGPKGIGKATLAYALARDVLGGGEQARRWVEARAHPDLFVLERQLNDSKPRKLRAEISVEDARGLGAFLGRTASAGWRVVLVDSADDLSSESANAILKLVEEPPAKTIMFLIAHEPGRLLRTLKSRCLRLALLPLTENQVASLIKALPLDEQISDEAAATAAAQAGGSPGQALTLLGSLAAKAFAQFASLDRPRPAQLVAIATQFAGRNASPDDLATFGHLLQDWLARQAAASGSAQLAEAHEKLAETLRIAQGFNLDRRQTVMQALSLVTDALKAS